MSPSIHGLPMASTTTTCAPISAVRIKSYPALGWVCVCVDLLKRRKTCTSCFEPAGSPFSLQDFSQFPQPFRKDFSKQGDTAYHWDCVQGSYQWYGILDLINPAYLFEPNCWNCWPSCSTTLFPQLRFQHPFALSSFLSCRKKLLILLMTIGIMR